MSSPTQLACRVAPQGRRHVLAPFSLVDVFGQALEQVAATAPQHRKKKVHIHILASQTSLAKSTTHAPALISCRERLRQEANRRVRGRSHKGSAFSGSNRVT